MQNNLIVLNKNDNVAVTPFIIPAKTKIEGQNISSIDDIPFGHKICLKPVLSLIHISEPTRPY